MLLRIDQRETLNRLFTDHCDLIANDIKAKLNHNRKEVVVRGEQFVIEDLRYQDDVLKLIHRVRDDFVRKLKRRKFFTMKLTYVESMDHHLGGRVGQFVATLL